MSSTIHNPLKKRSIRDAGHTPKLRIKLSILVLRSTRATQGDTGGGYSSFIRALAASNRKNFGDAIFTIGHAGLAASTVDPFAMITTAIDLPTSHYDDYSVVFN
jgi:hypothetical protein